MAPANNALWLRAKHDPQMVIDQAPYPTIGSNEVVISTKAVAMNPADVTLQKTGLLLTQYPAILGCDAAGVVQEVGADLQHRFEPGDHVFGAAGPIEDYKYSAFQEYVVLKAPYLAKTPGGTEPGQPVVLSLGFNTAATCLFAKETLALKLPPIKSGQGKTLLIWGASSSVGACAVQLAAAASYEVLAIASTHNHNLVRCLGASQCFDYHSPDLVSQIVMALKEKDVVGAFSAISEDEPLNLLCDILHQCEANCKTIASVKPGAEALSKQGVNITTNFSIDRHVFDQHVGTALWYDFLPSALAAGTFQCKPDPQMVGHGLASIQHAVDLLAQGVSAKKLVVTL